MPRASVREQIVDAAFEQFHRHGYNACGVKLITDSAGVPKGSFYNHFQSKEALALVVMDRYGETRHLDKLADASKPPLVRLRGHFEALGQDIEDFGYERGCVYGNFSTEAADHIPAIREGLREAFDLWTNAITATIREAQEDRSLASTQEAETLGRFLVNAWEGAIVGERAAKDGSSFATFFTVAFEVVLR
jgi:TetR/AcrR family transcriptional regulator, transcriptional repressor for nem operon